MSVKTVFGVILGLSGSVFINVGNNMMSNGMHELEIEAIKKAAEMGEDIEEHPEIEASKSKLWVVGTCIFVTGSLLNFASYPLAPACILACLESIQFVTNVLFAKFVNGAEISPQMLRGVIVTVIGCILAVICAPIQGAKICNVKNLMYLFLHPTWISYMVFALMLSSALYLTFTRYDQLEKKAHKEKASPPTNSSNIKLVCYSVVAAVAFGTPQVVLAKMLGFFVAFMTGQEDARCDGPSSSKSTVFQEWFTWLVIVVWLFLVTQWLKRLNGGLLIFDPIRYLPLVQGNFILWSIISGAICFQEFVYMESSIIQKDSGIPGWQALNWVGFVFGVIAMFSGLYLICSCHVDDLGKDKKADELQPMINHIRRASQIEVQDVGDKPSKLSRKASYSVQNMSKLLMGEGAAQLTVHQQSVSKNNFRCEQELARLFNSKNLLSDTDVAKVQEFMKSIAKSEKSLQTELPPEARHLNSNPEPPSKVLIHPYGESSPDVRSSNETGLLISEVSDGGSEEVKNEVIEDRKELEPSLIATENDETNQCKKVSPRIFHSAPIIPAKGETATEQIPRHELRRL